MVLSDVAIRRLIESGRIVIDPYDPGLMQPSSLDVRVDRLFRVFRNSRYPYIDVKQAQEELTELVEVDGDEAFILHPGEFVLGSTLERVVLPDDLVARLEGKALALDTEIPTPLGWRTMGELSVGDLVFDIHGMPTVVVGATEPMTGRPCREVVLSDGTTVVCDAHHLWLTIDENSRRRATRRAHVRSTNEIARTLVVRGEFNHQIPLAAPAQYPVRELPIDPYALGAWFGDGTTSAAPITCADREILDEIELAGVRVAPQRMSLGFRATVAEKWATLDGRDCGPKLEIQFTPDRPVFRLPRKLARQKATGRVHRFHSIVDVRVVDSVPVKCIEVSASSGTFLCTRSHVPTHNSSLGRLGLLIHSTAGFIDPGWDGHVTLELSNVANLPITIYPEMKIGQLSFVQLSEPAEKPYGSGGLGSKYQGQRGPTPSRYWKNFSDEG